MRVEMPKRPVIPDERAHADAGLCREARADEHVSNDQCTSSDRSLAHPGRHARVACFTLVRRSPFKPEAPT